MKGQSTNPFVKRARSWKSYLNKGLLIASDILPKIPRRRDPLLQKTVAILSIIQSVQKVCLPEKTANNPLRSMVQGMGLIESNNEQFVRLFFETELFKRFNVEKFPISDYTDVHLMEDDNLGTLLFVESTYSKGPTSLFYHSPDADFAEILRGVWDLYNNHIHLTVGSNDCSRSEFATFANIENPLYGSAAKQIDDMIARHKRFVDNGVPRSYMFYGQPGTGKSSAALVFAGRLGKRILKVDANSLAYAHVKTLSFLIEYLRPDFLLIDDVDKISMDRGLPTLLDVLQRFKTEHSFASVIMTANSIQSFDKGFLRPGRIDTWIEFKMPNGEERKAILENYLKEAGVALADDEIAKVVEMTDGLSQDYLREIVTCFKHDNSDDVAKSIELMKSLLGIKKVVVEAVPAIPVVPATTTAPSTTSEVPAVPPPVATEPPAPDADLLQAQKMLNDVSERMNACKTYADIQNIATSLLEELQSVDEDTEPKKYYAIEKSVEAIHNFFKWKNENKQ